MSSDLTIVMYHYVRELEKTRYPDIKGRRTSEFRKQIDHLRSNYNIVSMAEVLHANKTGDPLPKNAALLTFDDGYLEHYTTCFPILFDAGIEGSFFPPVAPIVRRELLDVNRIHFVLAVANIDDLRRDVDESVRSHKEAYGLRTPEEYYAEFGKPNRFDPADVIYVKRMLQVALPEALRNLIAGELFARYVAMDEESFAAELYATEGQFRVMQASGMYVGSHGDSHYWLNSIDEDAQQNEIKGSLDFLRRINSPVDDYWVMCYPYGGWNKGLLEVLKKYDCALGLTTEARTARIGKDDPLLLPRFDTNDIAF